MARKLSEGNANPVIIELDLSLSDKGSCLSDKCENEKTIVEFHKGGPSIQDPPIIIITEFRDNVPMKSFYKLEKISWG